MVGEIKEINHFGTVFTIRPSVCVTFEDRMINALLIFVITIWMQYSQTDEIIVPFISSISYFLTDVRRLLRLK